MNPEMPDRDGRGPVPPELGSVVGSLPALMASYRYPGATWKPSPNYWTNRLGHDMTQPSWVVLHTMVCCEPSAWSRFQNPDQQASSTYGVGLDGEVYQYVDEKDAPWTNGTSAGTGSNLDSITIEHEDCGDYNGPRTPALYRTSALLVRDICTRYEIPIDREHVILHNECTGSATACPDTLDVDRIVRMAAGLEPLPGSVSMVAASSEGTMVILHHPAKPGRLDVLLIDGKSHCVHSYSDGGAGGLDGPLKWADYGALPSGPIAAGTLAATWDDLNRLCVCAADGDGQVYLKVVAWDGTLVQDWSGIEAHVVVPAVGTGTTTSDAHIAEVARAAVKAVL